MAYYELVNLASGNLVGDYDTEADALRDVRLMVDRYGPSSVATIGLGRNDDEGQVILVAEGADLVARAEGPVPSLA